MSIVLSHRPLVNISSSPFKKTNAWILKTQAFDFAYSRSRMVSHVYRQSRFLTKLQLYLTKNPETVNKKIKMDALYKNTSLK